MNQREQEIFTNLWANANEIVKETGRLRIESRQVEALARALAVELAGLERKINNETTGFDPHARGHYGQSDS